MESLTGSKFRYVGKHRKQSLFPYWKKYCYIDALFMERMQQKFLVARLQLVGSIRKQKAKQPNNKKALKYLGYRLYKHLQQSPIDHLPF